MDRIMHIKLQVIHLWEEFMLANAAALAITGYQKYLSPYKGFCCAHRVHHGGASCSQFAKEAILEAGLFPSLPRIRERFRECKESYLLLKSRRHKRHQKATQGEETGEEEQPSRAGGGSCDPGPCDCLPNDPLSTYFCLDVSGDAISSAIGSAACDFGSCGVESCDLGACDIGACDIF